MNKGDITELLQGLTTVIAQAIEKSSEKQQEALAAAIKEIKNAQSEATSKSTAISNISSQLSKFTYAPHLDETFDIWASRYASQIKSTEGELKEKDQVQVLLSRLGEPEFKQFASYVHPKDPYAESWDDCMETLNKLFAPTRSTFIKRYECLRIKKSTEESIDSFIATLNVKTEKALVQKLDGEAIKCLLFVCGLDDDDLRSHCMKMMETAEATAIKESKKQDKKIKPAVTLNQLGEHAKQILMRRTETAELNRKQVTFSNNAVKVKDKRRFSKNSSKPFVKKEIQPCDSCGENNHTRNECKFRSAECHKCHRIGHIARACRSKQDFQTQEKQGKPFNMRTIEINRVNLQDKVKPAMISIQVGKQDVNFLVDSGADESVISTNTWKRIGSPKLESTEARGLNFTGEEFLLKGKCQLQVI